MVQHSKETLYEIARAEAALRALAARFATPKIADATLDRMEQIARAMDERAGTAPVESQLDMAHEFDRLLADATGNATLQGVVDSLSVFGRAHRLRAAEDMRDRDEVLGRRRIQQHQEIVTALRGRDPERVEAVVLGHLLEALGYLLPDAPQPSANRRGESC